MRTFRRALLIAFGAGLLMLVQPGTAFAHEARTIGDLDVEVGFANEPAYVGQPNAALISILHKGKPVLDLGNDLKVTIAFGDTTSPAMTLEPGFVFEDGQLESGFPGTYEAWFVPSQPGPYTFHFVGKVDGQKVDESFTSSPSGFDEVQDTSAATFPPVDAPSTGELATRIDQEAQRASDAVKQANIAASSAADDASSARTIAVIGLVVGAIGVVAGIAGLVAARKRG